MTRTRPTVFIGSSTVGLPAAKALQVLLDSPCEVTVWSQGVFGLSDGTLESLVLALDEFDFAVLVLTTDDLAASPTPAKSASRDNVLFELGLFMGALGKSRTFIVYDRTSGLALPSDLAGVSAATYEPSSTGNYLSALGSSATRIETQIKRHGFRDKERFKRLAEATQGFDQATIQMQKLVELIARSRKVELDIISSQFGPMIAPDKLRQMHQDLEDLGATLTRK